MKGIRKATRASLVAVQPTRHIESPAMSAAAKAATATGGVIIEMTPK